MGPTALATPPHIVCVIDIVKLPARLILYTEVCEGIGLGWTECWNYLDAGNRSCLMPEKQRFSSLAL